MTTLDQVYMDYSRGILTWAEASEKAKEVIGQMSEGNPFSDTFQCSVCLKICHKDFHMYNTKPREVNGKMLSAVCERCVENAE